MLDTAKSLAAKAPIKSPVRLELNSIHEQQYQPKETKKAFGQIDILVNNAGIYEFAPVGDITEEHFHKHFDLNVLGLILASQAVVKQFGPAGGSIINISSVASTLGFPNAAVYSGTK